MTHTSEPSVVALKLRSVGLSMAISLTLAIAKATTAAFTGSLSLWSDATHSMFDLVAGVFTFLAVRASHRPPDSDHPYGHGKFEILAALFELITVLALSGAFVALAVRQLMSGQLSVLGSLSMGPFVLLAISIGLDLWRAISLRKLGDRTKSPALGAMSLHYFSDVTSSAVVVLGLAGAGLGFPQADALGAIGVSLIMAWFVLKQGRKTLNVLLDTAPHGVMEDIENIASRKGTVHINRVRVRSDGVVLFVDVSISVGRTTPFSQIEEIRQSIQREVMVSYPHADLTITVDPLALDDETIAQKVSLIANHLNLSIHHLTIQRVNTIWAISVDLEVPGHSPLAHAHSLATQFEHAVGHELGDSLEIETHIEPASYRVLDGVDVSDQISGEILKILQREADHTDIIGNIHDVRVRQTEIGLVVNFHCLSHPHLTVQDVHDAVDEIERAIRQQVPQVQRVVGHAEPPRSLH